MADYRALILQRHRQLKWKAFDWLERGYDQRAEWMIYLSVDPRFDRLREDSRFIDLLQRIGFQTTGKAT